MSANRNQPAGNDPDKSGQPIDGLNDVPLSQLGEALANLESAQELIEDIEKFKNLSELLKEYSQELRTNLNIDYVIVNEHHWATGEATTLADSAAKGFESRADYNHSLKAFDPLLRLGGTKEGVELMVKLNICPAPNQMCIEDLLVFDEYPLLMPFKKSWPWQTDRAMAFTPLVFGEQQFPGAIGCIHSQPRSWTQEDCKVMLDVARQISRSISKERTLDRLVSELQLKVKEYFRYYLPETEELTDGELRVLVVLMRDGSENKEIAEELGSTERAVKKHVMNMLSKTGSKNRTQLALWGQERIREVKV
ncbi:MAG: GAF domain-containing protein [Gemmatimonadaceae bacterium]|nr:GAF domain-containing protein [Gloeobacterales cyanobacterium ES-bin-141]